MGGIADELELATAPDIDEEEAAILADLVESAAVVPAEVSGKGNRPAFGFERGGASWMAMRHKGSTAGAGERMKRRYKHLEKRGLISQGKGGAISVTKRGKAAMRKYERGMVARDKARRSGKPIGKTGQPVKLKRGEKMVFGRVVKVGP